MKKYVYGTGSGKIRYMTGDILADRQTLVLLPGLTADHRLFDRQIQGLGDAFNILTWDAPGHGASRPFSLNFTLMDEAEWLHGILEEAGVKRPILVGQSMGGYVSQCFLEKYPGEAAGFVSIDSAPLQRCYVTGAEIWLLKRTGPMLRVFPWGMLKDLAVKGCARTAYGQEVMRQIAASYTKEEYIRLSAHGYGMLADAMAADLPYELDCPSILICGTEDSAGSAKTYNKRWAAREKLPVFWIRGAGHNSNTDRPEEVNRIIRHFAAALKKQD